MIRLHDTMAREKRPFEPADPKRITMYVCGPTVYGRAHIGNARPAVVFDLLRRVIRARIFRRRQLIYARNVTDVDDKIINSAREEGVDTVGDHRSLRALLPRRHGRAGRQSADYRSARHPGNRADDRDDRGPGRNWAMPMRPKAMCCSGAERSRLWRAEPPRPRGR